MKFELPRDILIHGIYSTRKTSVAMTASKDYPTDRSPPFKPEVAFSDVGIIGWDSQPAVTFPHLGMELPTECVFKTQRSVLDENKTSATYGQLVPEAIVSTINASRAWAVDLAKKGKLKILIHDTLSTKDTRIVSYWTKTIDDDPNSGKDAGTKLYRNVLKTHSMDLEYWQNFALHFDVINIWLCHSAIKGGDAMSNDPKAVAANQIQRTAKGLTGAELGARITGQSWNYFYENVRMVLYQTLEVAGYGKKEAMWHTRSTDYAVKPCLPADVFPDKVAADFRPLFKLARGGV